MRSEQYDSKWLNGKQPRFTLTLEDVFLIRLQINIWSGDLAPGKYYFILSVCFSEPVFVRMQQIPDSSERNDDKLYFFFREKSLDSGGGASPSVVARVGRVCLVRHPLHITTAAGTEEIQFVSKQFVFVY